MLQGNIFRRLDAFEIGEKIRRSWVFLCETSPVVRIVYTHMFFLNSAFFYWDFIGIFRTKLSSLSYQEYINETSQSIHALINYRSQFQNHENHISFDWKSNQKMEQLHDM